MTLPKSCKARPQMPTLEQFLDELAITKSAFDKYRRACAEITEAMHRADEVLKEELQDLREEGVDEDTLNKLQFLAIHDVRTNAELAGKL